MDRKRRFVLPDNTDEPDEKKKFVQNVVREVLRDEKLIADVTQLKIDVEHLKDLTARDKKNG